MCECDKQVKYEFFNPHRQECSKCGSVRYYNPKNKQHIVVTDPDLWSKWQEKKDLFKCEKIL